MVDALSRRHVLISTLETKLFGLEFLKEMYPHDSEFAEIYNASTKFSTNEYFRDNGYLFKEKILCVPKCSIRDLLLREAHEGGLMEHIVVQKTFDTLHEHFYWPHMKCVVQKFCENCIVKRPNQKSNLMVCTLLYLFLIALGLILKWTLYWVCHEFKERKIIFLWLLTDFPKWLILFLVKKLMMLAM